MSTRKKGDVKKYLLIVEDERIWEQFKHLINRDLNTEILHLIKQKVEGSHGKKK